MGRFIMRDNDGTLRSAMGTGDDYRGVGISDRVTATRLLDIAEDVQIRAGEQGTIVHVDPCTGAAEVLMDFWHRGLRYWDNHVLLVPFDTDDILTGLTCNPAQLKAMA